MKRSSREVERKEFHPHADQIVQEYVDKFTASLLEQANLLAFQENADLVLSTHVAEALLIINTDRKNAEPTSS